MRGVLRDQAFDRAGPGDADVRRRGGERPQQPPRHGGAELQGYGASLVETPGGHNFDTWRDALDPHLDGPARGRLEGALMDAPPRRAVGARDRRARRRHRLRPLRPAGARLPDRARAGVGVREPRDGRRDRRADRGRAGSSSTASTPSTRRRGRTADIPLEERARAHGRYEAWILDQVVPCIHDDCGGAQEIVTTGCSLGAYHAANFALKRADLFPLALCLSGNYDPSTWRTLGRARRRGLLQQPDGLRRPTSHGDHLDWLRSRLSLLLVCGQGQWEDTTGALDSTRRFAELPARQGDPARARPVGPRRPARLAVVARAARAPSAALLLTEGRKDPMTDTTHLIGLLLGTEEDWPAPSRR